MLSDLHLIADAFLSEEELGRQRGSEESKKGMSPSDDQARSRNENENMGVPSMLPPV